MFFIAEPNEKKNIIDNTERDEQLNDLTSEEETEKIHVKYEVTKKTRDYLTLHAFAYITSANTFIAHVA